MTNLNPIPTSPKPLPSQVLFGIQPADEPESPLSAAISRLLADAQRVAAEVFDGDYNNDITDEFDLSDAREEIYKTLLYDGRLTGLLTILYDNSRSTIWVYSYSDLWKAYADSFDRLAQLGFAERNPAFRDYPWHQYRITDLGVSALKYLFGW